MQHSILPGLTLAITSLSGWVFGMRNNMINTLGEDYVTFAEANGLKSRTVALLYAALIDGDRYDAAFADVGELVQRSLLDGSLLRGEKDFSRLRPSQVFLVSSSF